MGTVCTLTDANTSKEAAKITGPYLGAIIVISCAFCFTPIELLILEIWPHQGFLSLLLVIGPLCVVPTAFKHVPDSYFDIKRFEGDGRVYELLGIRFFKRLVPNGLYINQLVRRVDPVYRIIRNKHSMIEFEAQTILAERCHLVSLLLMVPSAIYALMLGWYVFAALIVLPNIPLHVYPVLLQRYTRARIQNALQRR
jgi:Glycosyl-4,4'-diaponeurosporenoate acyltransferase